MLRRLEDLVGRYVVDAWKIGVSEHSNPRGVESLEGWKAGKLGGWEGWGDLELGRLDVG